MPETETRDVVGREWTEGVCGDGVVLLCDGQPASIPYVLDLLNTGERLRGCLGAMADVGPNVTAEAMRSVAYDTVMNLITPDVAEHQLQARSIRSRGDKT